MADSEIRVNTISANTDDATPVTFPFGLTIAPGFALTCAGNALITGSLTAQSGFSGSGSLITGLTNATKAQTLAFSIFV